MFEEVDEMPIDVFAVDVIADWNFKDVYCQPFENNFYVKCTKFYKINPFYDSNTGNLYMRLTDDNGVKRTVYEYQYSDIEFLHKLEKERNR